MVNKIYLGTSGWSFNWEKFFSEQVPKTKRFQFYSEHFDAVEINYSFYRLPKAATLKKWRAETAGDFVFCLKLSRYLTHIKRLDSIKTPARKFLKRYRAIIPKAGPLLVQLPPNLKKDIGLLRKFLVDFRAVAKSLDLKTPLAFEFRHQSWFEDPEEIEKVLAGRGAAWVFAHSSKYPYPERQPLTSKKFAYFRFHGPGELFASKYGRRRLRKWRDKIIDCRKNRDVYVFFNNDFKGYAAQDALILKKLLKDKKK